MAASEPSSLALHPPLIKTTVPATGDLTSEEQVPGWALGAHVITIVTSGSGLILATRHELWRLPLKEDKTRTIGFRSIISLIVRTTCSLLSTCWIVREGWDNASFPVCDLRNNDDSVDKNVPSEKCNFALSYAFRYYSRSGCTTDTGKLPKFRIFSNGRIEERRKYSVFCNGVLINCEIRLFRCNCCRCFSGFLLWLLLLLLRKKNGLHLSLKLTFNIFTLQYFTGNNDQNTIVQYRLFPRIIARYVRIHPWGWYRHICMRVEFYGCRQGLLLFFNQIMFVYANHLVRHKRRNIVGFLKNSW